MKRFVTVIFTLFLFTLIGCNAESVNEDVYGTKETSDQFELLSKPGIPASDVVEDARLYLGDLNLENSYIGLNMSIDDINSVLVANGFPADEPIVMHAGEVMEGWWHDGTSTSNIDGQVYIHFDKAGNVYEIEVEEDNIRTTSKGIGIGSTIEEFKSVYGEPEMVIDYTDGPEIFNYYIDKFYIRFLVEDGKVLAFKITETVNENVLYEFLQ